MEETLFKGRVRGFTLIELLITISMVMILLTIVAPSFTNLVNSNKQRTARDLLISALNTAQQQALSKNISVYLCPTSNGSSCSTWANSTGWLVYEDRDRGDDLDAPGEIIINQTRGDIRRITNTTELIKFNPTGHTSGAIGTFTLCGHSTNQSGSQITISQTGTIESAVGGGC
ncbi:GspH/FimT family pseudopilin [Psychromonas antarctica]|uniref:GspH/FimT family pseudopilin n=1 Tax=Psychromonas antarctica TaxID=67573 RepID=UPI001EE7FF5D|nr:GspH/FimT family pseudopilin [Psychromonas antarctica]MCG6202379.1 GspH/FimT family pseudopilin [Psychromonas antarctica]